jgi:hypothetical protein
VGSVRYERTLVPLVLALVAVALPSCDLFRPAEPEAPTRSVRIPNYSTLDSTLTMIAYGIEAKASGNGQAVYIGAFADTMTDPRGFHAFFDPQTISRMQQAGITPPSDWNRPLEEDFYARFVTLSQSSEYSMEWTVDETPGDEEITPETALLHRQYRVFAIQGDELTGTLARGLVSLYFVKVSADRWAVVRWQDREFPEADIANGEVCFGQRRLEP